MKKVLLLGTALLGALSLAGCSQGEAFDVNSDIKLYTRDTTSGTRDGFFTGIGLEVAKDKNDPLKNEGLGTVESNGDMITSIKNDKYGIGYISLSTLESSGLKGLTYEGAKPTEENVLAGSYTLKRNFNFITRTEYSSDTKKQIVDAFLAYLTTQEAKTIMKNDGGILEVKTTDPTWEEVKKNHPISTKDNSSITINFGGSTSVSNMAKALAQEFSSLCGNVKFSHDYHGSGDAFKKTQGKDKDNVGNYDIAFASRDFKLDSSEKAAEGSYGTLCIDAIVPVVNPENKYSSVTKTNLVDMYTGKINKWNELA